jgi:hypothetical protein
MNWGQGTKLCINSPSHSCGLLGFMTGGAGNLGQAGGLVHLVQFWEVNTWRE